MLESETMIPVAAPTSRSRIVYPDTDGLPIAENTLQFEWIVTIKGGLGYLFTNDLNVFVAGDLFWYPVEGHPEIAAAPDAMVVFGRPKGHRRSYLQWEEGGIAPQVVFEILSPSNCPAAMTQKLNFYREYGVEEYYIFDPDDLKLSGFFRQGDDLKQIASMNGHVSPKLNIKFELSEGDLQIVRPDGRAFRTYEQAEQHADDQQRRADQQQQRADQAVAAMEQLRNRLRALGEDPG